MSRAGDIEGVVVPESEVAADLGFKSIEDFKAWTAAGSPTGRCSNERCWRPAFWPDLKKPCQHCGRPIRIDVPGQNNP